MIDPSSSEEETDEEGVEEPHHHHHHHSGHHSQSSQRTGKVQDANSGSFGVVGGGANNSFGPAPGQLASGAGGGNLGGGNGTGLLSGNTAATSWGGGATNSLDVPPSSGSLPRYVHREREREKERKKKKRDTLIFLYSFPFLLLLVLEDVFVRPIRSSTKLQVSDSLSAKLIRVSCDVNAEETTRRDVYFHLFLFLLFFILFILFYFKS
jgi:hypothetical protein